MNIKFSFDDGGKYDLKIADILEKQGFTGIFFIPNNCELSEKEIYQLAQKHVIGGHTVNHPADMKKLNEEELLYEIGYNRGWLKRITRQKIEGFCYPKGKYNQNTIDMLFDLRYKWARTTLVGNTEKPSNPYRTHPSVHVYPDRKEYEGKGWYKFGIEMFKKAKKENGIFHLWGHGFELQKFDYWKELECFLREIKTML